MRNSIPQSKILSTDIVPVCLSFSRQTRIVRCSDGVRPFERVTYCFCDCSYQVVESMRQGMEPKLAAENAILRIAQKYPDFVGAVFAVNKEGEHAGACHGWTFQYSVRSVEMDEVEIFTVRPSTVSMFTK